MGEAAAPDALGKHTGVRSTTKKKGCDKKTITNKKDAVQELVDMELMGEEEKTKIEGKKGVLRTIKNLENPLHCCEKKRRNPVTKTVTKIKKARRTHRTKLLEKKKKRKKQNSTQRKLNRNRTQETKKKKLKKQLSSKNRRRSQETTKKY